jgi:undecaprenyl-diphosphatase
VAVRFLQRGGPKQDAILQTALLARSKHIEAIVKPSFALARPDLSGALVAAQWHSFPSGHALRGVGFFGYLASLIVLVGTRWWRWLVAAGAILLGLAIAASRVYVGVHYPSDVLAGALAAASWVILLLSVRRAVLAYREKFGFAD